MAFSSHNVVSDIFGLENVVQQTGVVHAKNILIDNIRDVFRQDRYFAYRDDAFGFPYTPSHLGLDPNAGVEDDETTRIFIGSTFRYDVKFNPAVLVKSTGLSYNPISFNQDLFSYIYAREQVIDGYGNATVIKTAKSHTLVGAWDHTFDIRVIAEDPVDRDEIVDIIMVTLQSTKRLPMQREGVFIKRARSGGEAETKYGNDNVYTTSINLEVRSEFKVHIPINDVCERIALCITFDTLGTDNAADALTINSELDLVNQI